MPVFHTKTIESILEPVAQQVGPSHCNFGRILSTGISSHHFFRAMANSLTPLGPVTVLNLVGNSLVPII